MLDQEINYNFAQFTGNERAPFSFNVRPIQEDIDGRRVGAGPADSFFFQSPHKTRIIVTGRRLGEVLSGQKFQQPEDISFREQWKFLLLIFLFFCLFINFFLSFSQGFEDNSKTWEKIPGAACPEKIIFSRHDGYRSLFIQSREHLRSNKLFPNELVKSEFIFTQNRFHFLGSP